MFVEIPVVTLFSSLASLFILLGVGFLAVRSRLVPAEATNYITPMLLHITLPATVFTAMLQPFDPGLLMDAAAVFVVSMLCMLSYAALSLWGAKRLGVVEGGRGMWAFCATFTNNGFMGYPIVLAVFGEKGLVLAVILGIAVNLLVYTMGAKLILLDVEAQLRFSWRKVLCTLVNAAALLGLIFFVFQLPVPPVLLSPINTLAGATTPLAMLVVGMSLAKGSLGEAFRDRDAITGSVTRLLVLPLLTWGVLSLLPLDPLVKGVILLIMAMPPAALSVSLGVVYGGNIGLASRMSFLSGLLCIATIPLMMLLP